MQEDTLMFLLTLKKLKVELVKFFFKGLNADENSYWYGRKNRDETKALMS